MLLAVGQQLLVDRTSGQQLRVANDQQLLARARHGHVEFSVDTLFRQRRQGRELSGSIGTKRYKNDLSGSPLVAFDRIDCQREARDTFLLQYMADECYLCPVGRDNPYAACIRRPLVGTHQSQVAGHQFSNDFGLEAVGFECRAKLVDSSRNKQQPVLRHPSIVLRSVGRKLPVERLLLPEVVVQYVEPAIVKGGCRKLHDVGMHPSLPAQLCVGPMPAMLLALPVQPLEERVPKIEESVFLQRSIFNYRRIIRLCHNCRQLPMIPDEYTARETRQQPDKSGFQNLRCFIDNQAIKLFHLKQILFAHQAGNSTHNHPGFCQQLQQGFSAAEARCLVLQQFGAKAHICSLA